MDSFEGCAFLAGTSIVIALLVLVVWLYWRRRG